jgi:hypothetical protein
MSLLSEREGKTDEIKFFYNWPPQDTYIPPALILEDLN